MSTSLLPYNDYKEQHLLNGLLNRPQTQQLFKKLDADTSLVGAGVVYIDQHYTAVKLREFKPVCRIKPIHIVIHEAPPSESIDAYTIKLRNNARPSKLAGEAVGTVLSCGAAVLGWLVVIGSNAAAPVTAGTSSVIGYLAIGAASASTVQCANGLYRTKNELKSPEQNDWLDSQEWYQQSTKALDLISLAGVGATGLATVKSVLNLRKASSRSFLEILKGMSRPERARLTKELARAKVPGLSNKAFKEMVRAGEFPKRFSNHSINTALMLSVKDAVGATLSFSGSASSGNVKNFVIGVYEAQDK